MESYSFRVLLSIVEFSQLSVFIGYTACRHPFVSQGFNCSRDGFSRLTNSFSRQEYIFFHLAPLFANTCPFLTESTRLAIAFLLNQLKSIKPCTNSRSHIFQQQRLTSICDNSNWQKKCLLWHSTVESTKKHAQLITHLYEQIGGAMNFSFAVKEGLHLNV